MDGSDRLSVAVVAVFVATAVVIAVAVIAAVVAVLVLVAVVAALILAVVGGVLHLISQRFIGLLVFALIIFRHLFHLASVLLFERKKALFPRPMRM